MPGIGAVSVKLALLAAAAGHAASPPAAPVAALELAGSLPSGMTVEWRADYATTSPDPSCMFLDDITGLTIPRTTSERIAATVANSRHSAAIPVHKTSGDQCHWQLRSVFVCPAEPARREPGKNACTAIFIVRQPADEMPKKIELVWSCTPGKCVAAENPPKTHTIGPQRQVWSVDLCSLR